jgi:heme exporter protein B
LNWVDRALALAAKDIRCEFRTRYAVNSLILFAAITLIVMGVTLGQQRLSAHFHAALIWIVILFASMQALASSFIREEETKTAQTLRIFTTSGVIFAGKLLFSVFLMLILLLVMVPLYAVLMNIRVGSVPGFLLCIVMGTLGIASATTIIAAIVAKATVKGALFAILSFPLLLPVLLPAIGATEIAVAGLAFKEMWSYLKILVAYPVIIVTASYLLFDYVWNE